ncbi:nucleoside diphosphate kinase 7 isoform X3 [Dermochelys coriacea]|nr:nucleoside diphosphate kinase 7 isoform X2 [Dermochelys coriacea]XP_043367637.1 nucleoside diphosphate kinase 7 isoform X3 [Dermochelys coriacea]
MYDVKNHRTFLKRTKYDDLHLEDLFIGNKVTVFSRHLSLVDYGDQYTARKLGSRKERTLALVKPDAVPKIGDLIDIIINAGLTITKAKMMVLSRKEAMDLHVDHQSKPFYNELLLFITSGPTVAMEILGDDAVSEWKKLLGPANSGVARSDAPGSIRAMFGTDGIRNAAHGPDSFASAAQELELFFPSSGGHGPANSAKFTNCTCCIIKPHAVNEGITGKIINAILDGGFEISALQLFNMERANVEEFYEIYKGVVAEYAEMVTELCSGPCIALEIRQLDPQKVFRDFCGPSDPARVNQCYSTEVCGIPLVSNWWEETLRMRPRLIQVPGVSQKYPTVPWNNFLSPLCSNNLQSTLLKMEALCKWQQLRSALTHSLLITDLQAHYQRASWVAMESELIKPFAKSVASW